MRTEAGVFFVLPVSKKLILVAAGKDPATYASIPCRIADRNAFLATLG